MIDSQQSRIIWSSKANCPPTKLRGFPLDATAHRGNIPDVQPEITAPSSGFIFRPVISNDDPDTQGIVRQL